MINFFKAMFRNYILIVLFLISPIAFAQSNLSYVDPTIGGVGLILEPTRPTVQLPNCMLRSYPMKKDQLDDQIRYFPLNVASHRIAYVFQFLPVSGESDLWDKKFNIEKEQATPYYYQVASEVKNDVIEFTTAERSAIFQVTFAENDHNFFRLGILNGEGELKANKRVITGTDHFQGMKAYLYAETDVDIEDIRYKDNEKKHALLKIGQNAKTVRFKYGISYISVEKAKQNLYNEIPGWNFDEVKKAAYNAWDKVLSQINVEGGTEAQKRVFYTALYRSYERMVDINEYGAYYSAFDHKVHQSDKPFYVDNWLWDNYIALEPLGMILNPALAQERIRSYITMYEQSGWMPSFAVVFGDWPAMTVNNAAIWMTDAWAKGLRNFDFDKAYEGIKKGSLEATLLPWNNGPATSLDSFYNEKGYMPGLWPGEEETVKEVDPDWEKRQSVSVTIDNSYSDWCIAQMADFTGNEKDRELFLNRSLNYRNVFRVEKGFVWPKDKNGEWIEHFDPRFAGREYFTENNAYTFNWAAKHDLYGLFDLMGGKEQAEEKLDQLFREDLGLPKFRFWYTQPDASGLVGQFAMGNEPSFHIPYLYNYLRAPWKTQKRIRMLLDTWFADNLFGIPGDEDGGGMSSFVVFSMMGFFPVTPGIPFYNIGSPVFEKITIDLPNGKQFIINAYNNSGENKYIQRASLNGSDLTKCWFSHEDLVKGALLELQMGDKPNLKWGSKENDMPPSYNGYRSITK
ncbi:GH92 family glycosyl hydrolase [Proteiniphilum sp. UBA5463]|uniref:GH92 family glycosyl hydrolase n=1 Tax=Proteiniphilum sp. UBA5463 TaxID=1947281 RepID=UPI00257EC34E|nr:GH92 family glycosyl hydrolase [Proteiniphilum sp. UBA5463]